MEGAVAFSVVLAVAAVALGIRLMAGSMDKTRIREYVEGRGGAVISIEWAPLGRGWFGDESNRIYEVQYKDEHGIQQLATCKTSLWTDVYWTEDQPLGGQPATNPKLAGREESDDASRLRSENELLKEEVERLKRKSQER